MPIYFFRPSIKTLAVTAFSLLLWLGSQATPTIHAAEQKIINIDLVGAGAGSQNIADAPVIPSSFFLAGARHGFEHSTSISGFSMAGVFQQVYPGITLALYTDEHHIEYAFLLTAGADPSRIRLRLSDVHFESITSDGHIIYVDDGVEVYQHAPAIAHIDKDGQRSPLTGQAILTGGTETSVSMTEFPEDDAEPMNGTRLNVIPGDSGRGGPSYTFYMSRFELTNKQWIRFLNDTQINLRNPRGDNMFFDEQGNIWINPAMQRDRDELFQIKKAKILYNPDRAAGDRYTHVIDDRGRYPFADHPAVGISWYGAVKYCNWLTLQSGRGPNEVCYREGTNALDWAPVTATNWANGFFTESERQSWLEVKGFRLPMFRLYDPKNETPTNRFNEFLKAGSWNGSTNVTYGYGRDSYNVNDANTLETSMMLHGETLPVGYFNGKNPILRGLTALNENAYGIYDLTGNVGEWLNDPARTGVPDARSMAGGSFQDRIRPLNEDLIVPPYASDSAGGFRPTTTFMPPDSWTQVNILFCFHSTNALSPELTNRFGLATGIQPDDRSPQETPADTLIPGSSTPTEMQPVIQQPGIIYQNQPPLPGEEETPSSPPGPERPGGGRRPFPPTTPPPSPPPPPAMLYILDVYSINPDSGVDITLSRTDYYGQGDGSSAFSRQYEFGETVTLTAPASVGGKIFQYWLRNGIPFETSLSVTVQMLSDLQLTAVYVTPVPPIQRTLVVDSTPGRNVPIVINRTDNNGLQNGNTVLSRIYNNREQVTVTAPASFGGETFQGWLRNGIPFSPNPTVTVTMLADMNLTARYGQSLSVTERNMTVTSSNPNGGVAISVSTPDLSGRQNGDTTFNRRYEYGETVTLTAPANAPNGNTFVRWLRNGVPFSTDPTITVTMLTDVILTAEYESPPPEVVLTVGSTTPNSSVNITVSTPDNNGATSGATLFTRRYDVGTTTTVTAPSTAPNGNVFHQWVLNGSPLSTDSSVTLTLIADAELIAVYLPPTPPPITRELSVRSDNPGSGVAIAVSIPDINSNSGGSTSFGRTYIDGAEVTLTAPTAAPNGNVFSHWIVDGVRYTDRESITLIMTDNRTVTAVYVEPPPAIRHQLTVESRNPNSAIVISVNPTDVNGQQNGATTFTRLYDDGENVTLTARNPAFPGSSNQFQQWLIDGTPISTNATINVNMWRDTTVTAVYGTIAPQTNHTLTVESNDPDSNVPISISVPDINTGERDGNTTFNRLYSYATDVTVTAPPVAPNGHRFEHWLLNGNLFSPNATVTLSMLSDMRLTAVYAPPPIERTLTVNSRNPENGVTIQVGTTDNRNNQNGSTSFERFYDDSETVTLTAPPVAPNGHDVFLRWERDGLPITTNTVVDITLYRDIEMTAVYGTPPTFNLTVKSDNPNRNIPIEISTPDILGRTDGNTLFVRTYNPGEGVTITAPETSPSGTVFQQWLRNGESYSTDRTVNVTMLADVELTAVYGPPEPVNRSLIVRSVNPDQNVPITISPNDIRSLGNGDTALQRIYRDGESVTVTAPPTAGTNTFQQWILNGSPISTNLTTTINMLQDHELIAVFGPPMRPQDRVLTVDSRNPNSGVPISVSQPDVSGNSDGSSVFVRIYNVGETTTLTAPSISGTNNTEFLRWERDGVPYSEDRTVTIEMSSDVHMTAVYGEVQRNVTLTVESRNPDNGVVISVAPGDLHSETTGTTTFDRLYEHGQIVTLTAPTTAETRPFLHWLFNGVVVSTNPVHNVTLLDDVTMTAVYGDPIPTEDVILSVRSTGPDGPIPTSIGATPDITGNASGTTGFQRTYHNGTLVTLTTRATSNGFNFDHWEIGGSVYSSSQTISLTLFANTTVTAVYVEPVPSISGL